MYLILLYNLKLCVKKNVLMKEKHIKPKKKQRLQ